MMFSGPPRSEGITNSPTEGMNTNIKPATMPALDKGTVMSQNALKGEAPKSYAASSKRKSIFTKLAYSGSTMKGKYT